MKNVTISLDDDLALKARVEAAKLGKSLSRYASEALSERLERPSQREALEKFLGGPPLPLSDARGNLPKGLERYDALLPGHQNPDLHAGSDQSEAGDGSDLGKKAG